MGIIRGCIKSRLRGIAHRDRSIIEFKRDISAGSVDRDDRGVLVCVGVGAVPGGVGETVAVARGESEWRVPGIR